MNRLVLIKHSLPVLDESLPAAEWKLSADGRARCALLAGRLADYGIEQIVTSDEPKAVETGRLLAEGLALPWQVGENLHEHRRPQAGVLTQDIFWAQVMALFARPDDLIFGVETGTEAGARFAQAVDRCLAEFPEQNLAIVAHGTVVSLFAVERAGVDGFGLWPRLGLPSAVVLSLPEFEIEEVIENVA